MLPEFKIRLIKTYDEYIAVAELQKEVWGQESIEIVPPSILMVNQKIGGIVAGAFTTAGTAENRGEGGEQLVAFVYGLPGFRGGKEVHWSHMLAVKPGWRGKGLGWKLKQYQRDFVIAKGIDIVHWTYDPLESVNAVLNLSKLGALPAEYVCDLYGKGEKSVLHKGIGTDRFILTWYMSEEARSAHLARYHTADSATVPSVIAPAEVAGQLRFEPAPADTTVLKIEIPKNIQTIKSENPQIARSWRDVTRAAFLHYFAKDFSVTSCYTDPNSGRCYYVMAKLR